MNVLVLLFALMGHVFFLVGLTNRLHSLGIPRRIITLGSWVLFVVGALIVVGMGGWWFGYFTRGSRVVEVYLIFCWAVAAVTLLRLIWFRCFLLRRPSIVRFHRRRSAEVHRAPGVCDDDSHHFLVWMPRNEILKLEISDWILDVPRLPAALDGLKIVHLSDLHFTGRVGKSYFQEVVRVCNEIDPDLVAITGDIVDRPEYLDWIADTLGRLRARHGVFFTLGNHDLDLRDADRIRHTLEQSGLIDLDGLERQIEIAGQPVLLAGSVHPWIGRVRETHQPDGEVNRCVSRTLRIALAHCPDELDWARAWDADLMLAGHTHGGQIRIPPFGAIMSPTRQGVKYVSGVFYQPPTILHVTRGVSGDTPIRWNCPPEVACLRLRYCAADLLPSGEPPMGVPGGSGRAAIE